MGTRKKRKLRKSEKTALTIVAVIIATISFIMMYLPQLGFPTWNELFYKSNLVEGSQAEAQPLSVHFIDVGQGDCTLIKTEKGNVLIDSGNAENGEDICIYLKNHNVTEIDYVVLTHPHSDHIGGAVKVIENIKVKNIIMPRLPENLTPTSKTYTNLLKVIKENKVSVFASITGDKYTVGDVVLTVIAPVENANDLNNMSVVVRADYGETSFLFQGDAESFSENLILKSKANIDCDVIKLGHHGSNSSSTLQYIQTVSPKLAVISCGKDNSYGHPHEETISTLNNLDIKFLRTDFNGNIIVGSDMKQIYCYYEKSE